MIEEIVGTGKESIRKQRVVDQIGMCEKIFIKLDVVFEFQLGWSSGNCHVFPCQ